MIVYTAIVAGAAIGIYVYRAEIWAWLTNAAKEAYDDDTENQ